MLRTFVIGDIHGAYRALRQCLERADFDLDSDQLICLGDVADGWPETKASIDELMKIKNLVYVLGNHDFWTLEWMTSGYADDLWLTQGGRATVQSYPDGVPASHINFLEKASYYYETKNKLFVHAGFNPKLPIEKQSLNILLWDRSLARLALDFFLMGKEEKITSFDEVYIGHTPVLYDNPIRSGDVWLMDTGAGWSGVLSMMNIDTKEVFTSDVVPSLYPGIEGRKKKSN
jgi:serine/threonine protein phosphatase 1